MESKFEAVEEFILFDAGPRCDTKDTVDFPELKESPEHERCYTCRMWEHYDEFVKSQKELGECNET